MLISSVCLGSDHWPGIGVGSEHVFFKKKERANLRQSDL